MAKQTTVPIARIALVLSLSALVGACSFNRGPEVSVTEYEERVQIEDRSSSNQNYTAVVPREPSLGGAMLEEDAPNSYTVVRGDTLWDISDRFLKEPWLWPQLWNYNPQISNPHLIYPGDEIALEYVNGRPVLVIERNGELISQTTGFDANGNVVPVAMSSAPNGLRTERMSPRIREESLDDAIPMIPGEAVSSFLVHPRVVPLSVLRTAPYVVGNFDGRLTSAVGHQIYVRGELSRDTPRYAVFRRSKPLEDPVTGRLLGYEVHHVSDVKLMHLGDPSTLVITSNNMETIEGDLLLPINNDGMTRNYTTRMPRLEGDARIVSLVNSISQSGRDQVVVINIGANSNIQSGDVLAIETRGGSIIDTRGRGGYERISMPNTRTGVVMVFKAFDKVSYALVMESTLPVRVNDAVTGI